MKKVAIIFGSKSTEHEVSCVSAANVIENVDREKYDVVCVGISKDGTWYEYTGDVENIRNKTWEKDLEGKKEISNLVAFLKSLDVAFPVLHGKYGEDGSIQGLFEMFSVNYCGPNIISNALCMDKYYTKVLVEREGIKVVDYILYNANDIDAEIGIGHLTYPVIIKPVAQGSSIGIKIVRNEEELKSAISYAKNYDCKILIEKYVANRREIECSVIGRNSKDGNMIVSIPGEVISANNELYDYDSKYNDNASICKVPADISEEKAKYIRSAALKITKILDIQGCSRIDFMINLDTDEVYLNEVNTIPGFTNISMYPKMLMHLGMTYKEVITNLIESANVVL